MVYYSTRPAHRNYDCVLRTSDTRSFVVVPTVVVVVGLVVAAAVVAVELAFKKCSAGRRRNHADVLRVTLRAAW